MKLKKKIVVCFSVTVFAVLLVASEILVHGQTVQTTPKRLQKISSNIWDIVENDNEIAGGSSMQTENQKPHETRKRTITAETVPYDGVKRSISCWGDSMMYGCATTPGFITLDGITTNISYATAPDMLSQFTGLKTYNLGVNGETSKEIATVQAVLPWWLTVILSLTGQALLNLSCSLYMTGIMFIWKITAVIIFSQTRPISV